MGPRFETRTGNAGPSPEARTGVFAGHTRWRWDLNPRTALTLTRFRGLGTHVHDPWRAWVRAQQPVPRPVANAPGRPRMRPELRPRAKTGEGIAHSVTSATDADFRPLSLCHSALLAARLEVLHSAQLGRVRGGATYRPERPPMTPSPRTCPWTWSGGLGRVEEELAPRRRGHEPPWRHRTLHCGLSRHELPPRRPTPSRRVGDPGGRWSMSGPPPRCGSYLCGGGNPCGSLFPGLPFDPWMSDDAVAGGDGPPWNSSMVSPTPPQNLVFARVDSLAKLGFLPAAGRGVRTAPSRARRFVGTRIRWSR